MKITPLSFRKPTLTLLFCSLSLGCYISSADACGHKDGNHATCSSSCSSSSDTLSLKNAAPSNELSASYKISKMSCTGCQKTIETSLKKIDGVSEVQFNLKQKTVTILMSKPVKSEVLSQALTDSGFPGEAL